MAYTNLESNLANFQKRSKNVINKPLLRDSGGGKR